MKHLKIRETDESTTDSIKHEIIGNDLSHGEKVPKNLNNFILYIVIAIFFVSSLISAITFLFRPPSPSSDIYDMLGIDTSEYMENILPSNEKIFNFDKPIPEQLSELLLSDNVRVYESNSNHFVMADGEINEETLTEISRKIKNAEETETEEGETNMHYLILFYDRRTVNFSLSETALEIYGKKYHLQGESQNG